MELAARTDLHGVGPKVGDALGVPAVDGVADVSQERPDAQLIAPQGGGRPLFCYAALRTGPGDDMLLASFVSARKTNVTLDVTSPTRCLVTRHNGTRQRIRIQSNMRH